MKFLLSVLLVFVVSEGQAKSVGPDGDCVESLNRVDMLWKKHMVNGDYWRTGKKQTKNVSANDKKKIESETFMDPQGMYVSEMDRNGSFSIHTSTGSASITKLGINCNPSGTVAGAKIENRLKALKKAVKMEHNKKFYGLPKLRNALNKVGANCSKSRFDYIREHSRTLLNAVPAPVVPVDQNAVGV